MAKLRGRRNDRISVESKAATKIQSRVRGWIFRRRMKSIRKKLKALRRFQRAVNMVRKNIRIQRDLDKNLNRQRERRSKYAVTIQKVWRGFLGGRAADKLRSILEDEAVFDAATKIQSIVKKRIAR